MSDLAAWISALTSVAALAAAIWAGLTARNLYFIENNRDRIAEQERRRADAVKVNAWVAVRVEDDPDKNEHHWGVYVVNAATTPVYDVAIDVTDKEGAPLPRIKQQFLPPGSYFIRRSGDVYQWKFPIDADADPCRYQPITKHENWRVHDFWFTDADGVQWHRDLRGTLTEPDTIAARRPHGSPAQT